MIEALEKMLILQDRDRRLAQLQRESKDIPARKKEIEAQLDSTRKVIEDAEEELKKNTAKSKQIEVEVEARQDKIAKLRKQQMEIKNNVEYRAIDREIKSFQQEIRKLEDKEIEAMELAEAIKARIDDRQTELNENKDAVDEELQFLDERMSRIGGEIEEYAAERKKMAEEIDDRWLKKYERIFNHWGDFAIVPIEENGTCGGCHMVLPPQVYHDVKKAEQIQTCSFCSRLLYLP